MSGAQACVWIYLDLGGKEAPPERTPEAFVTAQPMFSGDLSLRPVALEPDLKFGSDIDLKK